MSDFLDRCQRVVEQLPEIAAKYFQIRSETEGFTLIRPNAAQMDYHRKRVQRGFATTDDILKSRKQGFSTWKELEGLALTLFVPGFSGLIMGDEKEKTKRLFNIVKWAYERLPADLKDGRRLNEDRRDAIEIGGSTLYIVTAGQRNPARSDTLHWAHLTEVGFYDDFESIQSGISEALAESGKSAHLCQESTANGRNIWYDICKAAKTGASPDNLYFYEWWWSPKYSLPLEPGEKLIYTAEEENVILTAAQGGFQLTPEQIKWRRWKMLPTQLGAKRDEEEGEFAQEYPENFESAFLVGGRPAFKPQMLTRFANEASARTPIVRDKLPGSGEKVIWRLPNNATTPHIIGVDVAEGLAHGDWHCLSVWSKNPGEFLNVARAKVKCSRSDLAKLCDEWGRMFRTALLVVERNTYGGPLIEELEDDYHYPNLYRLEDAEGEETGRVGWFTSRTSKRIMISEFRDSFHSGEVVSYDPELAGEMGNIQLDDRGHFVTPRHKHDDVFMAACLARMGFDQARAGTELKVVSYA